MARTLKEIITEEFMTCYICMNQFQNPKILKCLHTFCETCILTTIRHQRLKSVSSDAISCPYCRTKIETSLYGEPKLRTNYPVKTLMELIKVSPNNEIFAELYRVQAGLNIDREHAIAFAEKSQSRYLETYVYELQAAVSDLRRDLTQYKKNSNYEKQETAKLRERLAEKNQTINYLRKVVDDIRDQQSKLKLQNDRMTNLSIVTWMTNQFKSLWNMFQMSVSWLPNWFQRKEEEKKHQ